MLGFETLAKQEGLSARFIKANKKAEETDS
jgi:hypothetical protein